MAFFQIPFVYNIYTNVLCNVRYFAHVIQIKYNLNQKYKMNSLISVNKSIKGTDFFFSVVFQILFYS